MSEKSNYKEIKSALSRIFLFIVLFIFIFRQIAPLLGMNGPFPDASYAVMDAILYFDNNYFLSVLLAELIFPTVIIVLLSRKTEIPYKTRIAYILSLVSTLLILFVIIMGSIRYYLWGIFVSTSLLQFPRNMTLLILIIVDAICFIIFLSTTINLSKLRER